MSQPCEVEKLLEAVVASLRHQADELFAQPGPDAQLRGLAVLEVAVAIRRVITERAEERAA